MQRRLVSILSNPFIVCKENFDISKIFILHTEWDEEKETTAAQFLQMQPW